VRTYEFRASLLVGAEDEAEAKAKVEHLEMNCANHFSGILVSRADELVLDVTDEDEGVER